MVGRRGEAPLVPPYRLRDSNKTMALSIETRFLLVLWLTRRLA